jgi:predicted Rossmann fold flavoprotein
MESTWHEEDYPRGLPWIRAALDKWTGSSTRDWLKSLSIAVESDESGRFFTTEPVAFAESMERILVEAGVEVKTGYALESISRQADGAYRLWSSDGQAAACQRLLIATGGERNHGITLARELGASDVTPLPAYLRLKLASPKLAQQFGLVEREIRLRCSRSGISAVGSALLSGRGLEGVAVSAMSCRLCEDWKQRGYRFSLEVDWVPSFSPSSIRSELDSRCQTGRRKGIGEDPLFGFSSRQWNGFLELGRIDPETPWIRLKAKQLQVLIQRLKGHSIAFSGMGLPSGERAWAGGILPEEIDWGTGASKSASGIYYAGEILDALGTPAGPHLNLLFGGAYLAGSGMALSD